MKLLERNPNDSLQVLAIEQRKIRKCSTMMVDIHLSSLANVEGS